ncbi:MAG: hypothetical protein IPP37_03135 [Saprospiraceae bacterium]|nr:hypothetical protein [Saprospiraceae bacterium]
MRYSWWNNAVYGKDQLRQRMAFALSQILVISDDADIGGHARGMASYYDMLSITPLATIVICSKI